MGGALALATSRSYAAARRRPNLLIIITDQQFAEAMSCRIGGKYLKTPNMDSLAASGTSFTRAYCPNPLCVPSRTSMFTGRYPVETGVETNDTTPIDAQRFPCMGTIFKRAGYATGFFGKWHMPFREAAHDVHGFEIVNAKKIDDAAKAAATAEFIQAKRDAPFLAVASFLNPHNICEWARGQELPDGSVGAPPALDQCPPLRPNHAPSRNEGDIDALMRRSYQATPMFPVGNFDEKKWREYLWGYYRMIERVDARIGRVLEALRAARVEENTVVVFLADHGDCQGSHRWNQKTVLFEEAARVPCIVSYKGVTKPGAVSTRLVHTGIDLIPTLCDYTGAAPGGPLPGLSLKDTANGKPGKDPRDFVVVSNKMVQGAEVDGRLPTPDGRMLCSQRYKYWIYSEGSRRESLFDLEKDPGETVNLAADPEYKGILQHHRTMLKGWCGKYGDSFP